MHEFLHRQIIILVYTLARIATNIVHLLPGPVFILIVVSADAGLVYIHKVSYKCVYMHTYNNYLYSINVYYSIICTYMHKAYIRIRASCLLISIHSMYAYTIITQM